MSRLRYESKLYVWVSKYWTTTSDTRNLIAWRWAPWFELWQLVLLLGIHKLCVHHNPPSPLAGFTVLECSHTAELCAITMAPKNVGKHQILLILCIDIRWKNEKKYSNYEMSDQYLILFCRWCNMMIFPAYVIMDNYQWEDRGGTHLLGATFWKCISGSWKQYSGKDITWYNLMIPIVPVFNSTRR